MRDTHTNPAIIRAALEHADRTSLTQAANKLGISRKAVTQWRDRRAVLGGSWPTDVDIAEWRERQEESAEKRRWMRDRMADYRERRAALGHMHIDRTGTMRRVQGLFALGYTSRDLAPHLDVSPSRVSQIGVGYWEKVHIETAVKVLRVYNLFSMTRPDSWQAKRQRRHAEQVGWVVPLAWDDETIDDPNARPTGVGKSRRPRKTDVDQIAVLRAAAGDRSIALTRAERFEVVRMLTAQDWSEKRITRHTGIKADRYRQSTRTGQELAA